MHKLYRFTGLIFLTYGLYGCNENTNNKQTSVTLETLQQKASYSYGVDVATRLKQQGIELDTTSLTRGISDAYIGRELAINDEARTQAKTEFQEEFDKKSKQANQDNAKSQFELAEKYRTGNGVKKDLVKAAELYKKAADGGHELATTITNDYTINLYRRGANGKSERVRTVVNNLDAAMAKSNAKTQVPQLSYPEQYALTIKSQMMSGGACDTLKQQIDTFATTSLPDNVKIKQMDTIVGSAERVGCMMY